MSNLVIEILSSTVTTVPTAKGSYQVCELAFKNKTFQNKVEGKKIMSFAEKEAFAALSSAPTGSVFTVFRAKDDKGYWKWNSVTAGENAGASPAQSEASATSSAAFKASPKSTYETPEERAARQVMIVRQSSISSAVAMLTVNNKKHITAAEVIDAARVLEAYVMGKAIGPVEAAPAAETGEFDSDIPF